MAGLDGNVFGMDEPGALFRFNLSERTLERNAVRLPVGNWHNTPLIWARDNERFHSYNVIQDPQVETDLNKYKNCLMEIIFAKNCSPG